MKLRTVLLVAVGVLAVNVAAPPLAGESTHLMLTPDEVTFSPGPKSLPAGAEFVVLSGDPSKEGMFAMRLKVPDGYHIPPHFHSQPETVTVLSGTFHLGQGEAADRASAKALAAGSFFSLSPGTPHFAWAEGETVVQLNSTGPWTLEYVNKADDPRNPS